MVTFLSNLEFTIHKVITSWIVYFNSIIYILYKIVIFIDKGQKIYFLMHILFNFYFFFKKKEDTVSMNFKIQFFKWLIDL